MTARLLPLSLMVALLACDGGSTPEGRDALPDEPSLVYRNIDTPTAYAGDEACVACHEDAVSVYQTHAMARTFHPWTAETRVEAALDEPIFNEPSGFYYAIVEQDGQLYQEEFLIGPDGRRLHELQRRMDYVMGSGNVARTYFTEENGRLFQLPLTWYSQKGWDFSPGYEINNARFDRLLPDRCIACHGSYPEPFPHLEGKYANLPPGIGCERCHGPGALHVSERTEGSPADSSYDDTIVNPKDLPIERRLDVCDQCHVHTSVTVLREREDAFSYKPAQPLRNHIAIFKTTGSIDIVSHADRLRQSACFLASRATAQPLECATCHNPHKPSPDLDSQNQPCRDCHTTASLEEALASSPLRADHAPTRNCVGCHMPKVKERTVPHGSFTEHWIRVITPQPDRPRSRRRNERPVEPYFERDRTGLDAEVYQGMGEVVYATLATDRRLLSAAAEALDRALESDTTFGDAHFVLGLAYRQLGQTDDAIRAIETSLRLDPDRPERLHALARAYASAGRNADSVAPLYQRALDLQPALAWIRADYARFLQARGQREEAEDAYRTALAERPSLDVATFNLGTLLAGQGRLTEATEAFQNAVRLNPSIAEGLAPLLHLRADGNEVAAVRELGSLLETLPQRGRGPNAVQLTTGPQARRGVLFVNVPPGATVRVLEPDGALVRVLSGAEGPFVVWDLLTQSGNAIAGGLYRVEVLWQDGSGRPARQRFWFGVVRVGSP